MHLLTSFSLCFSPLGVSLLSSMSLRISASLTKMSSLTFAAADAVARNDKSTPTVALRGNNQRNSPLTANPPEIHHLFEKKGWSKVFKRFIRANSEPDFAAFEARCRMHWDAMATPIDLPPVTGAELYTQEDQYGVQPWSGRFHCARTPAPA